MNTMNAMNATDEMNAENTFLGLSIRTELAGRHAASRVSRAANRQATGERGEGVISLAIAVLIMAVIGAAMYLVFSKLATDAGTKTTEKIATIN